MTVGDRGEFVELEGGEELHLPSVFGGDLDAGYRVAADETVVDCLLQAGSEDSAGLADP